MLGVRELGWHKKLKNIGKGWGDYVRGHAACFFKMAMNQPFTNLMERYSGEAELAKQQEEKAERRERIKATIFKTLRRLVVVAMLGAAVYYFKPIKSQLDVATAKMFPQKPQISQDQQAKINVVDNAAAKGAKAVDDAMK